MQRSSRDELVDIVRALQRGHGDDAQVAAWIERLDSALPHPAVDLVFYPDVERSPEEIVDTATAYQPREL